MATVAPLSTVLHYASGLSAGLLEGGETCGDVELEVETAAAIASLDHHNDRLLPLA